MLRFAGKLSGLNEENTENKNDEQNVEQQNDNVLAEFLDEDNKIEELEQEAELLTAFWLSCIVYKLQLATKDSLQQVLAVDKIIKEAGAVVGFVHCSLHWRSKLKKIYWQSWLTCGYSKKVEFISHNAETLKQSQCGAQLLKH